MSNEALEEIELAENHIRLLIANYENQLQLRSTTEAAAKITQAKIDSCKSVLNYFEGRRQFLPEARGGWIEKNNLLEIHSQRYWLTDEEIKHVNQIREHYPNAWEAEVIRRMSTLSL